MDFMYGYMVIRSVPIELLNREDLAYSPSIMFPSISIADSMFRDDFPEIAYEQWISSLGPDTRVILISLGGAHHMENTIEQLDLVLAMYDNMQEDNLAFVLHLKVSQANMDEKISDRVDQLREMNIFILCGVMPLGRPFAKCAMVINHGGHGTVSRTIRNGKPQLCVPFNFQDQIENGLMVQDAGLGRMELIPCSSDDVLSFIASVRDVCNNPLYRRNALSFAEALKDSKHNGCSAILVILNKLYLKMLSLRQQNDKGETPGSLGSSLRKLKLSNLSPFKRSNTSSR